MREKINKLSKGIIDGLSPIITYEPTRFCFEASNGEKVKLEVNIASKDGLHMKGLIYASDPRFNVLTPSFGGQSLTLSVEVQCKFMDNTSSIEEQLCLVTNGGEFFIPVSIKQNGITSGSGLSELETMKDFVQVAKVDKDAAVRIFEYKGFINSPCMKPINYKSLYHAFTGRNDKYLAVEEFLIACGYENIHISGNTNEAEDKSAAEENNIPRVRRESVDDDFLRERRRLYKKYSFNYMNSRLLYEICRGADKNLPGTMIENLDKMLSYHINEELVILLKAEAMLLSGAADKAAALLDSVKNAVRNNRQEMLFEYCLLEYLEVLIYKLPDKKASFIRLLNKFMEEDKLYELFPFLDKLDRSLVADDRRYYEVMNRAFKDGSRSPYLYLKYCDFINSHPEYLHDPTPLDIHALHFGARLHLLSEDVRKLVALRVNNVHGYYSLYYALLKILYKEYRDEDLIKSICAMLIRSDRRDEYAHEWYRMGIEDGAEITGIYSYYMASIPDDPDYEILDKVIEHFAQGDNLSSPAKTVLYCDILRRKKNDYEVFSRYAQRINDFALAQAKDGRVDDRLAYIYSNSIRAENINSALATSLPGILNTYKITTDSKKAVSCIVLYPTLLDAQSYSFDKGQAYVPIYSDKAVVLLQDNYGNRYASIPYNKTRLMQDNGLEAVCDDINPGSLTARLNRMDRVLAQPALTADDASFLEYTLSSMPLFPEFKTLIYSRLIEYYNNCSSAVTKPQFLIKMDKKGLSPQERQQLINAYISCGCYREAYEMCRDYGISNVTGNNLMKMVSGLILENMFTEEAVLLYLATTAFNNSQYDSVILDYLCEHYNGPTETMFRVLQAGINEVVETYDLEERLFAQMIFVNHRQHLDQVFEAYTKRKKISESVVRAYFTIKTSAYFFSTEQIDPDVFAYLEKSIKDPEYAGKLPLIYRLSLTKHYSHMEELRPEQKEYCQSFINSLLNEKIIFPYYKRLSKFVKIPAQVMNSAILVYPAEKEEFPLLKTKITPIDNVYHQDPMQKMYLNIHLRRNVLFTDELWKYEIYENEDDVATLKTKGEMKYDQEAVTHNGDRFCKINEMIELSNSEDNDELHKALRDYVYESNLNRKLFDI